VLPPKTRAQWASSSSLSTLKRENETRRHADAKVQVVDSEKIRTLWPKVYRLNTKAIEYCKLAEVRTTLPNAFRIEKTPIRCTIRLRLRRVAAVLCLWEFLVARIYLRLGKR
jgi:hypothetical protein